MSRFLVQFTSNQTSQHNDMNLALFHFIRPYWLLALIPLVLLTFLTVKHKLQRGNWVNVCDEALLPYILQEKPTQSSRIPLTALNVTAALLAIIALAGPTWERIPAPAFRNDAGLVIALDLSKSMLAADIKPSRIIRARYKITDILKQRKDGQTALLVYTDEAFTVTPLTTDTETIASQLEVLEPNMMPSSGSRTSAAIEKAVSLFKQAGLQKGQILLLTDDFDSGEAANISQQLENYQLSILGVGTEQGAPISLPEGGFLKDSSGAIVIAKLPIADLQNLASSSHGIYQTITDTDDDVKTLLATVDNAVQKAAQAGGNPNNNLLLEKWDEKGVWLLLIILPLAALNFRRGLLGIALLVLLPLPENSYALSWQDLWQTKDQQAYSAYQRGDYAKAAQLFENPAWQAAAQYKAAQFDIKQQKQPTTAIGFYNQGNVLAQSGHVAATPEAKIEKFKQAINAYNQALNLQPTPELAKDAKANKKIVEEELKKLEQLKQDQNSQNSQNGQNKDKKPQDSKDGKDKKGNKDSQDNKESQEHKNNKDDKNSQSNQEKQDNHPEKNQPNPQQAERKKEDKPEDNKDQQAKKQQAGTEKKPQPDKSSESTQALQDQQKEDEQKRAEKEFLERIPDDPSGLLRRKFKYQYQSKQQQNGSGKNW